MKIFKQTYFVTTILIVSLFLFSCNSDDNGNSDPNLSSAEHHTYNITLENGETFTGELPKYTGDTFYYASFINTDEDTNQKHLAILLNETQKVNLGVAFILDTQNQPNTTFNPTGIRIKPWNSEKIYTAQQYSATLENYEEHSVNVYGEDNQIASFTLHFEGTFSNSLNDEIVSGSGTITIAAP